VTFKLFHFVDDNEDFLEFASALAEVEGYAARIFSSPLAYLEFAASEAYVLPTALFSDVRMPEMNGLVMLDRVREMHPDIRTAIITGFMDEGEKDGHCLYLRKPAQPEILIRMFEQFSRCVKDGPDEPKIGCREADDRGYFRIDCWECPAVVRCREEAA